MWYHRLALFLVKHGLKNNEMCPCIFIKRTGGELASIAVNVDDLSIIGTTKACAKAAGILDKEFEKKNLGQTALCIGIQLAHVSGGVLMHQSLYTRNLLKRFNMGNCNPLPTPMVVRKIDVVKDVFKPKGDKDEPLGLE